jgi:transcriptional regulator with XRE-family HTH domain
MKHKRKLNIEDSTFGKRLARIRKSRSLTQKYLAKRIGISARMLAYYETESNHIPAALLPSIVKILNISSDELLGIKSLKVKDPQESIRLLDKLKKIAALPRRQRSAVLEYAEALLTKRNHK